MTYVRTIHTDDTNEITRAINTFACEFGTPDIVSINSGKIMKNAGAPYDCDDGPRPIITGIDDENGVVYVHDIFDVTETSFPIVLLGVCEIGIYSKQE